MNKRKVAVVVTARPSYSRVKTALKAIEEHPNLQLQLILAGSALLDRYGNARAVVKKDGFKIAAEIFNVLEGESPTIMAKTTGIAIIELATAFQSLQPDIVVTIADRFETIATSIAASYQNIPLCHIQGGEVTGNIDEKVRHANTKLADLHLVASHDAFNRVVKMGENPSQVVNTGCPSMDLARNVLESPVLDFNPFQKYGGVGHIKDWEKEYIVVMQHPVTTEFEQARRHVSQTLMAVKALDIPTFWFWPNVDAGSDGTSKGIRSFRELEEPKNIQFFKNMEPIDFLKLLKNSKCLVGNSSVGIRECALLGVPVVNLGSRQGGRMRGRNVLDCGHSKDDILDSIKKQMAHGTFEPEYIYGDGDAGKKIADALANSQLQFHKTISY